MSIRTTILLVLATLLVASITSCAPKQPAGANTAGPAPAAVAPESTGITTPNGEAGGETALVTYADAAQGFSIAYPGNWTLVPGSTAGVQFAGGDDSMKLEFAQLPAGKDAMAYAKADVVALSAAYPGFQQVGLAASTEVKNAIVLGFEAKGFSRITGKPVLLRADRYYMPLSSGRIAVLTMVTANNRYDREGVRDIALSFKLLK